MPGYRTGAASTPRSGARAATSCGTHPPSEWPAMEKRWRNGQHVFGHPVSMDLIAAAPTQNDHVVDPRGGFAIGSCGPSFNGLHTDAVPVVVEFQ